MIDMGAIGGNRATDPTQLSSANVDKQTFLKLLVTQLRSQDPFEPMKNEDFLAQLAQFSQLESLNNIYEAMGQNNVLQGSVHNALSTSLIGSYGVTLGNTMSVADGHITGAIYAMPAGGDATITITDENGNVVRTIQDKNLGKGDHSIQWDGKDENGNSVGDGEYTAKVEIVSGSSSGTSANVFNVGRIRAVRFFNGAPVVVIGEREYLLSDVLEVSEDLPGAKE